MNIAIIGTGNVGSALSKSLSSAGHAVESYGRDADWSKLETAEVVVLAVPYSALSDLAHQIARQLEGKVVIDTSNPLKPDLSGLATETKSAGEEVAALVPESRVVKGFNTLFASVQGNPAAASEPVDALFATDDDQARATFAKLAESVGFRPVYVGPLAAARELEAVALLNIRLQVITGGSWNTTVKLVDAPEQALAA